jgi:hypothetical protein
MILYALQSYVKAVFYVNTLILIFINHFWG